MKFKLPLKTQIFLAAKIIYQKKAGHNIPTLFYHVWGDLDYYSITFNGYLSRYVKQMSGTGSPHFTQFFHFSK